MESVPSNKGVVIIVDVTTYNSALSNMEGQKCSISKWIDRNSEDTILPIDLQKHDV